MKLSEAIRKGCSFGAQNFGSYRWFAKDGSTESCALGSAALGLEAEKIRVGWTFGGTPISLGLHFPILERVIEHPMERGASRLGNAIIYLNDTARWTREAIAAWVATYEEELEGARVVETQVEEPVLV